MLWSLFRLFKAVFSSLVRLWALGALTKVLLRSFSLARINDSSATEPIGGFHCLSGFRTFDFLIALSTSETKVWLWESADKLGVEMDDRILVLLGSKKVLILKFLWNLSKSRLKSPWWGSPGVGQKFNPFSKTLSSEVDNILSEILTTVKCTVSLVFRTLFLKANTALSSSLLLVLQFGSVSVSKV